MLLIYLRERSLYLIDWYPLLLLLLLILDLYWQCTRNFIRFIVILVYYQRTLWWKGCRSLLINGMTSLKSIWLRILGVVSIGLNLSGQVSSGKKRSNKLLMLQLSVVHSFRSLDSDSIFESWARRDDIIPPLKLWLLYHPSGWAQQHLLFRFFFNNRCLDSFFPFTVLGSHL